MARAKNLTAGEVEELPESDKLADFPHPRHVREVFGHQDAQQRFHQAFASGRMPHAWLITGPEGIGKATLAYQMARFILASSDIDLTTQTSQHAPLSVPDDHPALRQISALSHPNLLLLRKGWNSKDKRFFSAILVDDVRKLKSFFGLTAGEDSWRVVIVDQADHLNENAANALLKSLEEPPQRCIFLLLSSAPANVLTTIRSRCRKLDLSPLNAEELAKAIQKTCSKAGVEAPDEESLKRLTILAEGSTRRALELHTGNGLERYEKLINIFRALPKLNLKTVDKLAEDLGPVAKDADFQMTFSLLKELLHRLVKYRAITASPQTNEAPQILPQEAQIADQLIAPNTLAQWAELWERIEQSQNQAAALNLDRKILILETFTHLRDTAGKARG